MKRFSIAAALLMISVVLAARPVDSQKARSVAEAFLHRTDFVDVSSHTPYTEFYTFTFNHGEGFVLVAADDCVTPVLGYSLDSPLSFGPMPANLRSWLDGYEAQIRFYREQGAEPTPEIQAQWGGKWAVKNPVKTVDAMVKTKWDQGAPYNNLCPIKEGDSQHAYTGCTATAMAQIIKYWNFPPSGYGQHSYKSKKYDTLSADFSATTYQWDSMPTKITNTSNTAKIEAIATLMSHCGISVDMDYSTTGSGAFTLGYGRDTLRCSEYALVENFKYRNTLRSLFADDFEDDMWIAILKKDFDAGHPILYTGYDLDAGHAFVADGYDSLDFVHINWGWSGLYDGFYQMGHLNPGEGSSSSPGANSHGKYNMQCAALIGIEPNYDFGQGGKVEVATSDNTMGSVTGAGSYDFGQFVTLMASANEGHRFVCWSDGNRNNPRRFTVTGGDRSFTAVFDALHPDTMHYASSNLWFGETGAKLGDKYWGIRYPAASMLPGYGMTGIQFFPTQSANFDIEVFEGSLDDADMLFSTEVFVGAKSVKVWTPVVFDSTVRFEGNKPVWVRMHSKGVAKVAVYTTSAGNIDSRLWGKDLSTDTLVNQSWMIRGIFQHPDSVGVEVHAYGSGKVLYGADKHSVAGSWFSVPAGETVSLYLRPEGAELLSVYVNDIDYRDSIVMVDTIGADTYELYFKAQQYTVVRAMYSDWNGIDPIDNDIRIAVHEGHISVSGIDSYSLYDISGRRIANPRATLAPGVYMLQPLGGKVRKVVVPVW